MFIPAASAIVIGTLDYSVSPTRVNMNAAGVGSFIITVPESATPYAGVEFEIQLPNGVSISSVSYSLTDAATNPPMVPPGGQKPNTYYFSCYALENKYAAPLICTVNVTYTGSTETTLTINEIKQYSINGHDTDDLVSDKTTSVTLVPHSGGSTTDPTNPGQNNPGGSTTLPGADPPLAAPFPFTDVRQSDWFYNNVYYMWDNKLMNGTSQTLFSPNSPLTRGMVVTVLYRMEGEPNAAGLNMPFPDVAADQWYTDAVKWAAENGIVLGHFNGLFAPNDNVTREQLAAILHRYQKFAEKIPPNTAEARAFTDADSISDYAKEDVNVLVMQEIITGRPDGSFDPRGNATRAEFAAMLNRYLVLS